MRIVTWQGLGQQLAGGCRGALLFEDQLNETQMKTKKKFKDEFLRHYKDKKSEEEKKFMKRKAG